MFFDADGPVPESLRRLQQRLHDAGIPHIFIGAMAMNAHRYERMTRDVDVCVRPADLERFRSRCAGKFYEPVAGRARRFRDRESNVTLDVLISGEVAGRAEKQHGIRFPDPDEAEVRGGIPVPSLARLIELKLVTWRLKGWADVIELIRANALHADFAEQLQPGARALYRQCFDQMKEEDKYNAIHEARDDPPASATDAPGAE
ncbi:MAG: hypothetical protein AB7Q17_06290 [Phycisphaerae bacterium]